MGTVTIREKPEILKNNKQIAKELKEQIKRILSCIKNKKITFSEFVDYQNFSNTVMLSDDITLDEKLELLANLYNCNVSVESQTNTNKIYQEECFVRKSILGERIQELLKKKIRNMDIDIIDFYCNNVQCIETLLEQNQTIKMDDFVRLFNNFRLLELCKLNFINYEYWIKILNELSKRCIPITWEELKPYNELLDRYMDKYSEKTK